MLCPYMVIHMSRKCFGRQFFIVAIFCTRQYLDIYALICPDLPTACPPARPPCPPLLPANGAARRPVRGLIKPSGWPWAWPKAIPG